MKVTKAQQRVLHQMIDAKTTVLTVNGRGGTSTFFRELLGKPGGSNVRWRTMFLLLDKGLVKSIGDPAWDWRGREFEITESGRAAVK